MKKSVFGRRNAILPSKISRTGVVLVVLVVAIIGVRLVVPGAVSGVLAPVAYVSDMAIAGIAAGGAAVTGPAELSRKLTEAKRYATAMEEQNRVLASRVADLETLLGSRTEPAKGVVAYVIARPPQSPYDALVIDQGSDAGVGVGGLVTGAGGIPLGRVASVTRASARVLLLSAPGVLTEAWAGEARIALALTGAGAGAFTANAPREATVLEGDSIYVAAAGSLPIGVIRRVDTDPADPSKTVYIDPITNPFSISSVIVYPPVALP
ncbi:MAG: hypothetical protein KBC38_03095 [Candidatus Pacebacteria bacterium]|nr:hypothetical protein [Candidatus Paceibacterota bacterium]MBP9840603.1 hypothetical protein [Candidatus Paceibacterota bacterium]